MASRRSFRVSTKAPWQRLQGGPTVHFNWVYWRTYRVARASSGNRIEITGSHFGSVKSAISVALTPSLGTVSVISCNDTVLVVDTGSSSGAAVGDLKAVVTHSSYGSSGSVKVGSRNGTGTDARPGAIFGLKGRTPGLDF